MITISEKAKNRAGQHFGYSQRLTKNVSPTKVDVSRKNIMHKIFGHIARNIKIARESLEITFWK